MRSCPHCHLLLETTQWDGPAAYGCRSCGGVWIVQSDAALLMSDHRLLLQLLELYPGVADLAAFDGLPAHCPDCRTVRLEEAEPAQPAVCPRCGGVWLEARDRRALAGAEPARQEPAAEKKPPDSAQAPTPQRQEVPQASVAAEPTDPLERLLAGNLRFAEGRPRRPNQALERRAEVAQTQAPFAVVITCSDSRVVPELIFDVGLGDLFVIRSAGNTLSGQAEACVGYAVERFGPSLVLVLGHSRCSAVRAAVEGAVDHSYLRTLVAAIRPAVDMAMRHPGNLLDNAVRCNTFRTARRLRAYCDTLDLQRLTEELRVVPAFYDLDSGRVTIVEEMDEGETAVPLTVDADIRSREPLDDVDTDEDLETDENAEPSGRAPIEHTVEMPSHSVPIVTTSSQSVTVTIGSPTSARRTETTGAQARQVWCPRCRAGYSVDSRRCTRCGVTLVDGSQLVPCLACRAENKIEWSACWSCQAELHPAWLQSGTLAALMSGALRQGKVRVRRAGTTDSTGCSSVIVFAAVAVLLLALGSLLSI